MRHRTECAGALGPLRHGLLALALLPLLSAVSSLSIPTEFASAQAQSPASGAPRVQRLAAWGGYSAVAPENTLAAIQAAVEADAPRLWLDIRASSDGELMLLRDDKLDRTTDCSGPVASRTAAAIAACDAGSWFDPSFAGQRVPTLAQALAAAGDLPLILELHSGDHLRLLEAVRPIAIGDRVTVVSRDRDLLGDLAQLSSVQIHARLRVDALDPRQASSLPPLGIAGVAVTPVGLNIAVAAVLQAAGLELSVSDADDEAAMFLALEAGAEAVGVARVAPLMFAAGLEYRSYTAGAFDLTPAADQQFSAGLGLGDMNADGRADLVLGAPRANVAGPGAGAGWLGILFGEAKFPGRLVTDPGDEREGEWGAVLAAADFGGDGYEDLVVGVPQRDFNGGNSGAIWLRDGAGGGIGSFKRPIGPQPQASSHMGAALATGDFDGDGLADLAVSAPDQNVRGQSGAGRVFILPGQAGSGAVTTGALQIDREIEIVPGLPLRGERLGASLAMGDFNGDDYADLAMGAVGSTASDDTAEAGSILLAFGGPRDEETGDLLALRYVTLDRAEPDLPGEAERAGAFAESLVVADFDGDGFDDLAVGAPGASAGGIREAGDLVLLFGRADLGEEELGAFDLKRSQRLDQNSGVLPGAAASRAGFGASLGAGDLDGDGRPDLLVGSREMVDRVQNVGTLTVIRSGDAGLDSHWAFRLAPGMAPLAMPAVVNQAFASHMGMADLNGDGAQDLLISAPGSSVEGIVRAGMLSIAFGYRPDLPGLPTVTARPPTVTITPTPTFPVTPSITPTASITPTPSRTPTASDTPRATASPLPPEALYLPISLKLRAFLGRYPTPAAAGDELR